MFNFDFFTFWAPFWRFWEPLGPLLGGFGPPKCAPRASQSLREAYFFLTFLVFVAALSISFDLGGFGDDFGRVLGRFGMVLGWNWARILDRFDDLVQRYSTVRPLRFCTPLSLGFADMH